MEVVTDKSLDWYMVYTIYLLSWAVHMAIIGCKDRQTQHFLTGGRVAAFQAFADAAVKALTKLQAAVVLSDLRSPPSNRFEALRGDRSGQYNIRINAQYRVCFIWVPHGPESQDLDIRFVPGDVDDVEITDYH